MLSVSKEFYLHSTILIKTGSVKWGYFGPKVAIFITIFCPHILFSKVSPYIFFLEKSKTTRFGKLMLNFDEVNTNFIF